MNNKGVNTLVWRQNQFVNVSSLLREVTTVYDGPALDVGAWDINSQQKQKQKVNEIRVVHPCTMRIERNRCASDSDSRYQKREKK
jgi:hypothetical protein